jgi:hypothetical protein
MMKRPGGKPDVSVVVVVFDMAREAARTLFSLSAAYQRHIQPDDYEVIVVDNGSDPPFDPSLLDGLSGDFRLVRIDQAPVSPAHAVNRGLAEARGEVVGVMIDGARIATPGMLHFARHGARLYDRAVVVTLGWFLGFDLPRWAMKAGYDRAREDDLLASIGWPEDGYRLFEIATMDGSSVDGWFSPVTECNALFMRRATWDLVGGMDERFDAAGGGFANLDLYRRAGDTPGVALVVLLGEATFHQAHGGASTGAPAERFSGLLSSWAAQYEAIHGSAYAYPNPAGPTTYLGVLPRPALARFVRAAADPVPRGSTPGGALGPDWDPELWSLAPIARPTDPTIAALVDLAHTELRARRNASAVAVARLARERAPDEPEPQRLLALLANWLPFDGPPVAHQAEHHLALAEARRLLGDAEAAAADYRAGQGRTRSS